MPTVQRARREITARPLPAARRTAASTPTAEGAGLAEARAGVNLAVARVGAEAVDIGATLFYRSEQERRQAADEAKRRADTLAVIAAETRLGDAERHFIYDPQTGILSRKGKDALSAPDEVDEWFTKTSGEIEAGLSNDEQRIAFARVKAQRGENIKMTTVRHVDREIQTYVANETAASVANSVDLAIANALDPVRAQYELQRGVDTIRSTSKQLGLTPAQEEQQVQALRGTVHLGIIDRLLANDQARAAEIYFEEASAAGQIPGDKLAAVEKALKEGNTREKAQQETARIMSTAKTETDARQMAKQIDDSEVQDETLRRIEHEFAVSRRMEDEATEVKLRGIADILDRTPDVSKIPPKTWSELSPAQRSAFRAYADALVTKPGGVETDLPLYYTLRRQATSTDPEERAKFQRLNLTNYIHKLGKTEFKELTNLQDPNKAPQMADGIMTNQQVVDNVLRDSGISPTPDPEKEPEKTKAVTRFRFEVERQVAALGKEHPTNQDIKAIADELMGSIVTEKGGGWIALFPGGKAPYDTTRRVSEVLGEIPADMRRQIEDALRAAKEPVTPRAIAERWIRRKQREAEGR